MYLLGQYTANENIMDFTVNFSKDIPCTRNLPKEFAHVKLLSILDAFKSIVIEIGYLQLFCFNELNAATFACEAVVKNLKLLRKKEMGEKIDPEDEEDI